MPRNPYPFRERRRVKIKRQPNDGVAPSDDQTRQLVRDMKEQCKNFTPVELKAALNHEGHDISLDVIIGVLNGK